MRPDLGASSGSGDSTDFVTSWRVPAGMPLKAAVVRAQEVGLRGLQLPVWSPGCDVLSGMGSDVEALRVLCEARRVALSLDCTGAGFTICTTSLELSRGALTYLARVLDLAERLAAGRVVVRLGARMCHGSDRTVAESASQWAEACWQKAVRDNIVRLAGLAVGRCDMVVDTRDLTPPVAELLSPVVSAGYLSLCLDMDLMSGSTGDEQLSAWIEDHLHHVHVVRVHHLLQDLQIKEQTVRCLAELVRLNVHEWTIVLHEGEQLVNARDTLGDLLTRAFRQVTGEVL